MSTFSKSLNAQDRRAYTAKRLARIDKLVNKQPKIEDEKGLETFLQTLPADLAENKEKIEIFLRHRDIIVYTQLSTMQTALFCFSLKTFMQASDYVKIEKFLEGSSNEIDLVRATELLAGIAISNPRLSLACFSLLYSISDMIEEESTEQASVVSDGSTPEQKSVTPQGNTSERAPVVSDGNIPEQNSTTPEGNIFEQPTVVPEVFPSEQNSSTSEGSILEQNSSTPEGNTSEQELVIPEQELVIPEQELVIPEQELVIPEQIASIALSDVAITSTA